MRSSKRRVQSGLCAEVIKHVEMRDERDKRSSVISNWSSLVCIRLEAFTLCDALVEMDGSLTHAHVEQSIVACFARKTTSTLSKRFSSMNKYVNFCCRNALQFFPVKSDNSSRRPGCGAVQTSRAHTTSTGLEGESSDDVGEI